MSDLYIDPNYKSPLSLRETEKAIKEIKDYFEGSLAWNLNLQRVSAPLFVRKGSGVNDDLNGIERKVTFQIRDDNNSDAEIVFSLAKWKRMVLADYGFAAGEGLYTDMNAIRPDEESLDNLHSLYVDQWDWERVITAQQRNLEFLKKEGQFTDEEIGMLPRFTSWAITCGDITIDKKIVGFKMKRILDFGRM